MSNFLANLVNRSLGKALTIKPRLSSFFETTSQGMSVDRPPVWEESEGEVLQSPMEERAAVALSAPRRRTPPSRPQALEQETRPTPPRASDPMPADGRRQASRETPLPYEEEQAANPATGQVTRRRVAIAASFERPPARAAKTPGERQLRPPFAGEDELDPWTPVEDVLDPTQSFLASDEAIPALYPHAESHGVPTQGKRAAWAQEPESTVAPETHRDPILSMARSAARREDRSTAPPPAAHESPVLANVFFSLRDPRFKPQRHTQEPTPAAAAEPTVQVTIGRLEVRTVAAPANTNNSRKSSPVMSLNEYLHSKRGGA
jgi:hypothetical protein